ncbi:MAG: TonB-dependent receptor plug domain-containing protein, partial [Bacteroidota bacterium]
MWRTGLFVLLIWAVHSPASGQVTLVFLEEHTDSPIAGVSVTYSPKVPALSPVDLGKSDSLGKVSLPEDLPGSGWIVAKHPSFSWWRQAIDSLLPGLNRVYLQVPSFMAEEVVLSAKRLPDSSQRVVQAMAVIDQAEIQLRQAQTMAEVLAGSGQVFVQKSQMGGGSPNLRGFEANKVLLVVDGIRMNNHIYRSGHLQNAITLDPYLLQRSEVLFGPGSVLYGSVALGGVIHFISRQPQLQPAGRPTFTGNYTFRYGQVNQEKIAHLDWNWGSKRWASLTSISVSDFEDLTMGAWRPNHPDWGRRDSLVRRIDGRDHIVPNPHPLRQSPSGYRQFHGVQKLLYVPRPGQSHLLNLQLSSTSDIPRYDRLTQTQDGRLRFAEWAYGPQTRLMAAYRYQERSNRWAFDQVKVDLAYQLIEESRTDRQQNN